MNSWEEPRLWIENVDDVNLRVIEETSDLLQQITQPVTVIAIVGLQKFGKSYLMNRLAGKNSGFALGSTEEAKTKGIWIWCMNHPLKDDNTLILIDTEGFKKLNKENERKNFQIFSLASLLSSTLIFNHKEVRDRLFTHPKLDFKMLNSDLSYVNEMMSRIQVKNYKEVDRFEDFTQQHLPNLIVAIRDFDEAMEVNEFENRVRCAGYENQSLKQNFTINSNGFKSFKCTTFTRPVANEEMFSRLSGENKIAEWHFESQFVKQSDRFCKSIYETSSVKTLKRGQNMNGSVLAFLAEEYVNMINLGNIPCIQSAITQVAQQENNRVIIESIKKYIELMEKLEFPLETDKLNKKHQKYSKKAIEYLSEKAILDDKNEFTEKFAVEINENFKQFIERNNNTSKEHCEQRINQLHDILVGISIQARYKEYTEPGGFRCYCNDMDRLLRKYNDELRKGPKAEEVRIAFLIAKEEDRNRITTALTDLTVEERKIKRISDEKMATIVSLERNRHSKDVENERKLLEKDLKSQRKNILSYCEERKRKNEKILMKLDLEASRDSQDKSKMIKLWQDLRKLLGK